MESIVKKLSEIENAASAIITSAENQKAALDETYHNKTKAFDENLEKSTTEQLQVIKDAHDKEIAQLLLEQSNCHAYALKALQEDYDTNHSKYAEELLKQVTMI
ncbi:MAG: hypothetical protein FWE25_08645 [Lachnospiraceae bacterium]|nr:hypothetical protein [Lachnospiraceae bacterium]